MAEEMAQEMAEEMAQPVRGKNDSARLTARRLAGSHSIPQSREWHSLPLIILSNLISNKHGAT